MIRDINKLKRGTKVKYSFYKNVTFEGVERDTVIMKDKHGNNKEVFQSLFVKYAVIDTE